MIKLLSTQERDRRWANLRAEMEKEGMDVLVVQAGGHGTAVPMLIAGLCLAPVVGTSSVKETWNSIPMTVLFVIIAMPIMGRLFTNTGLMELVSTLMASLFSGMSPLMLSITFTAASLALQNLLPNAGGSMALPVITGVGVTLCYSMNANPLGVMLPFIVTTSFVGANMLNVNCQINYGYGWYEVKDGNLPGLFSHLLVAIVLPMLTFLFAPLAGLSLTL